MSKFVDQNAVEIVSTLDINLRQRFAHQARDRSKRLEGRVKKIIGTAGPNVTSSLEFDPTLNHPAGSFRAIVLGGLEVVFNTSTPGQFGVTVTAGAALVKHSPVTLARPVSWTGAVEPDDDPVAGTYFLAQDTVVNPPDLPALNGSGSVSLPEWWAVVVTPTESDIEVDTNRRSANFGLGSFDTASDAKVIGKTLTPSIVRGSNANASINDITIPAGSFPIAYIFAQSSGAGLQNSFFYDARSFVPISGEPNMILGRLSLGRQSFKGWVSARINGEWVHYRTGWGNPVSFASLKTGIAAPFNPAGGVAYLYLCKPRGGPLRFRGYGNQSPSATNSNASSDFSGVLVISPTAPQSTIATTNVRKTDFNYKASSQIVAPPISGVAGHLHMGFTNLGILQHDCICIGMFPYSTTSDGTTSGHPIIASTEALSRIVCTQDGWISGEPFANNASKFVSSTFLLNESITGNNGVWSYGATPVTYFGGVEPFNGMKFRLFLKPAAVGGGGTTNAYVTIDDEMSEDCGLMTPFVTVNGSQNANFTTRVHSVDHGEQVTGRFTVRGTSAPALDATSSCGLMGIRFPYGQPLS